MQRRLSNLGPTQSRASPSILQYTKIRAKTHQTGDSKSTETELDLLKIVVAWAQPSGVALYSWFVHPPVCTSDAISCEIDFGPG